MLTDAHICADVATSNLDRARRFYEGTFGLKAAISDQERGVYYRAGGGTMLISMWVSTTIPAKRSQPFSSKTSSRQ